VTIKNKYTVIRDTRENQGWIFRPGFDCEGTVDQALKTGDYTIEGYEHLLCIERKATPDEISRNLHEARFVKELERMEPFKYKFIVCEFSLFDLLRYPDGSSMPEARKAYSKVTGNYLLKRLIELELRYNVHMIYAGNKVNAYKFVDSLFRRVIEAENG
jgi:ERCC4-type nuclease